MLEHFHAGDHVPRAGRRIVRQAETHARQVAEARLALGGVGTIFGALVGGLIVASLSTGLQMMNVAPAWQYVVKGAVLVLAVFVDVTLKKRR